jgi:hypothetical protein
MLWSVPPKTSD